MEEFLKPMGLGLQADFDLDVAAEEMGERLRQEVTVRAKAR